MARPNLELVRALRFSASWLAHGSAHWWSNFARRNCGHLVHLEHANDDRVPRQLAVSRSRAQPRALTELRCTRREHVFEQNLKAAE